MSSMKRASKRKAKRLILISALIILVMCLCGCSAKPEITNGDTSFSEEHGTIYNQSVRGGKCATYKNINYYFSSDITDEQIYAYIDETQGIMEKIEKSIGKMNKTYHIYVCEKEYNLRVDEDTLYTSIENIGNMEHIIGVSYMIQGKSGNYGLAYGLATDIAREKGMEVVEGDIAEAIQLYDTEPVYFDMNYACFSEYYADEQTIEQLKIIADNYFRFLKENNMTDVVSEYTPEKQREYLNQFLAEYGKAPYDNSDMDNAFVYSGGNCVRLVWENVDAKYFIEHDFEVVRIEECFDADMLNSGYANLRELMLNYGKQTAWVNEKLAKYGVEHEQGTVVFTKNDRFYGAGNGGVYYPNKEVINVFGAYALQHEYVHHATEINGWLGECLAHYLTYYPTNYEFSYDMQSDKIYTDGLLQAEGDNYAKAVVEHLGRELDWTSAEDYEYLNNAYIAQENYFNTLKDDRGGTVTKVSFMAYLARVYGEDKAIEAALNNNPEEVIGEDWEHLIYLWKTYIKDEYAWMN